MHQEEPESLNEKLIASWTVPTMLYFLRPPVAGMVGVHLATLFIYIIGENWSGQVEDQKVLTMANIKYFRDKY